MKAVGTAGGVSTFFSLLFPAHAGWTSPNKDESEFLFALLQQLCGDSGEQRLRVRVASQAQTKRGPERQRG